MNFSPPCWGDELAEQGIIWEEDADVWNNAGAILIRNIDPCSKRRITPQDITKLLISSHQYAWNYAFYTPGTSQTTMARDAGEMLLGYEAAFTQALRHKHCGVFATPLFLPDDARVVGKAFGVLFKMQTMLDWAGREAIKKAYANGPHVDVGDRVEDIAPEVIASLFTGHLENMGVTPARVRRILTDASQNRLVTGNRYIQSDPGSEWTAMNPAALDYIYKHGLMPPGGMIHPASAMVRRKI